MDVMKEKSNASFGETFSHLAAVYVLPDRLTPGRIASACAIPIPSAWSQDGLEPAVESTSFRLVRTSPVATRQTPMASVESKALSTASCAARYRSPAGMHARTTREQYLHASRSRFTSPTASSRMRLL